MIPDSSTWIPDGFWNNKTAAQYEAEGLNLESSEQQLKGKWLQYKLFYQL